MTLCVDINLFVSDVINDGNRGLINYNWSLYELTPNNNAHLASINNYIYIKYAR